MSSCKDKRGFSLIELSIVIMIIGLLFALGLKMLAPLVQRLKHTDTKEGINAAYQSLIGYAATNNRLPSVAEFQLLVKSNDVWGNDLVYRPADEMLVSDTVCERSSTKLSVDDNGTTIDNVAFFLLSRGANQNIQTDVEDASDTNVFYVTIETFAFDTADKDDFAGTAAWPDPVGTRLESYKDIVKYITLNDLRIKAGCVGQELKILNTTLPACDAGAPYIGSVFADGGVPFNDDEYEWCRQESADSGLTFKCDGTTLNTSACTQAAAVGEQWELCDRIEITGKPDDTGSFNLTFFVRDNNDPADDSEDNFVEKSIILTVDPSCLCDVLVENNSTQVPLYYKIDSGSCQLFDVGDTNEVTIVAGEQLHLYSDSSCATSVCDKTHEELHNEINYTTGEPGCEVQLANTPGLPCDLADE